MSILRNHDSQESLIPEEVCEHFLQVGLTIAILSQSSCDYSVRPSHDPASGQRPIREGAPRILRDTLHLEII